MAVRLPSLSPVAWVTLDRLTQQILWVILFAVLAPILGPRPYGLFSIVMVFVGFCEFILLEGAIEALVTVEELDYLHTAAANFTNGGIALAFGLAMSALAPWISTLFHDDEIKYLIWALALLPALSALSAVPIAVLRRSLKYKQLAVRSIFGLTIGGVCGIALALAGAGVWALVLQVLAQRIAELTIAWIAVPVRFGCKWSAPHFRELRPVAMNVFAARIMTLVSAQLPRIVLGYTLGPTEVGLFALANRFLDVITGTTITPRTAVGRIELRAAKVGSAEFERKYAKMVQNVAILSFPCLLGVTALVPELFRLWLDQRWLPGVVPTQLILLSGLPFALLSSIDVALLAGNLSGVFKKIANFQGLSVAAVVLCAAPFGLNVTCLALAIRQWMLLPIFLGIFGRACRMPAYSTFRPALRPLIGATIMAAFVSIPFLRHAWLFARDLDVAVFGIAGMMVYVSYLYFFARGALQALVADVFLHRS